MFRSTLSLYSLNSLKNHSLSTKTIPEKLGKELVNLFKQSRYDDVISKVENSAYKDCLPMMKLVAMSHRLLKEEHEDLYRRTQKQVEFLEKMNILKK